MPRRRPRPAAAPGSSSTQIADGTIRVVRRAGRDPSPFASDLIFRFTLGYLYEWDEPKRPDRAPSAADVSTLLDSLARAGGRRPRRQPAPGRRHARRGRVDEMAERFARWVTSPRARWTAPMASVPERALGSGAGDDDCPRRPVDPVRWIGAEERDLYQRAFGERDPGGRDSLANPRLDETAGSGFASEPVPPEDAAESIVRRYLQTHALVGLDDLIARYPIGPALATERLERWAEDGNLVRLDDGDVAALGRPAEPRRGPAALRRAPAQGERGRPARGLRRFPGPSARRPPRRAARRASRPSSWCSMQLQGFAATLETWETDLLPRRVRDFRPGWLDEILAAVPGPGGHRRRPGRASRRLRPARFRRFLARRGNRHGDSCG